MRDGVWMRICDVDGVEQSSVMVLGDYTFWMHSFEDGKPMLIDYEHEPGRGAANAHDVCELARKLRAPAAPAAPPSPGGTQLLRTGAAA
jgi:hypothetical protein